MAAVTRGTATVTGTYPGTSQTIALSVTKGEYLHRTVGGGAEEDLDMLPGQASTLLWIQRDPVTVHAGTNASVYVLAAQAATSTMSISAFGDAVGVYDATTAGDIKLTTVSTAEVNPQLVNSQGSAPISPAR